MKSIENEAASLLENAIALWVWAVSIGDFRNAERALLAAFVAASCGGDTP